MTTGAGSSSGLSSFSEHIPFSSPHSVSHVFKKYKIGGLLFKNISLFIIQSEFTGKK
jgi:hypothetical protein